MLLDFSHLHLFVYIVSRVYMCFFSMFPYSFFHKLLRTHVFHVHLYCNCNFMCHCHNVLDTFFLCILHMFLKCLKCLHFVFCSYFRVVIHITFFIVRLQYFSAAIVTIDHTGQSKSSLSGGC